ncbi:hypothetical protein ColLi_13999 [Colletotrichum liriopes]|uniref:Uncharacterized protein n=1 Tax=Colletotrichum liriopes TaxID=708192 RepID=A0AA37H3B6_9PEZI|nr:hypothetical protein ColLi_13999 [Colletotrichum liriopes]
MISLQVKLVALHLASQVSAVQCPLGSPGHSKYILDAIRPLADPDTGRTKCCPEGTLFDGNSFVLGVPKCPPATTLKNGRCISTIKPLCEDGKLEGNIYVTTVSATCPPPL